MVAVMTFANAVLLWSQNRPLPVLTSKPRVRADKMHKQRTGLLRLETIRWHVVFWSASYWSAAF